MDPNEALMSFLAHFMVFLAFSRRERRSSQSRHEITYSGLTRRRFWGSPGQDEMIVKSAYTDSLAQCNPEKVKIVSV
jgi:hypothetical protein